MAATNWIKRPTESAKKLVKNATGNLNDSQAALANLMDGRKYENLSPEVQKRADDLQASIAVKTRLVQYYTSFQKWVNEGNKVTDTHDPFKDFAKKVGITRNDYIGKSSNIGTADIPGISDIQIKDGVIRTRTGFIPSTEATTAQTAAASGREGEPTTVKQQADGTYSIIGSTTGKILESGIGSSEEALAIQTQRQAGSTPSVSGAADVFAVEPVLDEEKAAVESGEATIATQEQLTGASTPSASTRQIRSVDELNSLASLGLTESDITRQGSAIFLKEGVDETFLTQRGTSGTGTELVEAGAGSAIDSTVVPELGTTTTATAVQSAQAASLFPDRAAILAEQMEALGLGTTSDIAQLQQTIGEGIIGQEKALRELPETIRERTQNIGVTNNQLNRLIATERSPIAQALKDLLMSRSLLGEQLSFAFQQAEFITEGEEAKFNRFTDLLSEVGLALDPTTGSITESFVARESRFDREAKEAAALAEAEERDTQIITAGGRSLLVDRQSGQIITDFGAVGSGGSSGGGGGALGAISSEADLSEIVVNGSTYDLTSADGVSKFFADAIASGDDVVSIQETLLANGVDPTLIENALLSEGISVEESRGNLGKGITAAITGGTGTAIFDVIRSIFQK